MTYAEKVAKALEYAQRAGPMPPPESAVCEIMAAIMAVADTYKALLSVPCNSSDRVAAATLDLQYEALRNRMTEASLFVELAAMLVSGQQPGVLGLAAPPNTLPVGQEVFMYLTVTDPTFTAGDCYLVRFWRNGVVSLAAPMDATCWATYGATPFSPAEVPHGR